MSPGRHVWHSCLSGLLPFSAEQLALHCTAGYGSHAIGDCWLPAWLVGVQCILSCLTLFTSVLTYLHFSNTCLVPPPQAIDHTRLGTAGYPRGSWAFSASWLA
jgi:hypothetical protein